MTPRADGGQALPALLGGLILIVGCAVALAWVGGALLARGERQRAVDLAALAGARVLADLRPQLLEGADAGAGRDEVLARARVVASRTAERNGVAAVQVRFDGGPLPAEVRVTTDAALRLPGGVRIGGAAHARAEAPLLAPAPADGEYRGPFFERDGKPIRPDVALAYDRMAAAAHRAGLRLAVISGFRTYAEQAALFAAHPDPRWVAPPGRSLHRLGTELDLGPPAAFGWLLANAGRFGFLRRYPWEPWHYGYTGSPGSASVGFGAARAAGSAVPGYVPERAAPWLRRAAARWGVGAALLAAQREVGAGFAHVTSAAIEVQGRRMRALLRRLGSVPLALAAYHAGLGQVAGCMCVPPDPATQSYVRRVVALARGSGEPGTALVRLLE
ncbi:unannotated protein [freshwater metagenome]|uniref:Unannotated protein n=1 Tax=freshwater metagenome TaxID=449393 RepID=A0A6J7HQK3_9ZZZZ